MSNPISARPTMEGMANTVLIKMPERKLDRADVKFVVKRAGSILGTLAVSRGSVVWFPTKTAYGCKMGWRAFDKHMQKYARHTEKR
jgi:hypothetical protein